MRKPASPIPRPRTDRGMVTSEYATGAVGAACIACAIWLLETEGGFWTTFIEAILAAVHDVTSLTPSITVPPPFPPVFL